MGRSGTEGGEIEAERVEQATSSGGRLPIIGEGNDDGMKNG